jgi:predicted Zn finger-like uncharacterized protein
MIAGCPKCGARYRIESARLRPEGLRLRCSRCEAVFRVTPPAERPVAQPSARAPEPPRPPADAESDRTRLVLVADADVTAGKALAQALIEWGLEPVLVHDGVEAILMIQRTLPRAVILDAGLPKMFGFQVCELVKRNESLRSIQVVLVGAIHDELRYRRPPNEIYGADAYVERPQLPEALRPILRGFGFPLGGGAPPGEAAPAPEPAPLRPPAPAVAPPAPRPAPPPVPEPARRAAPPAPSRAPAPPPAAEVAPDPAVADAERLARIIVSDIVLYNQEKFEAGIRDGNVVDLLGAELEEGRGHFAQRVDARVRGSRDFLADELVRVARIRGMK